MLERKVMVRLKMAPKLKSNQYPTQSPADQKAQKRTTKVRKVTYPFIFMRSGRGRSNFEKSFLRTKLKPSKSCMKSRSSNMRSKINLGKIIRKLKMAARLPERLLSPNNAK